MGRNEIMILMVVACMALFLFSLIRKKGRFLLKVSLRSVLGIVCIYLINAIFTLVHIPLALGVNLYTIAAVGLLGLPSLAALYGIVGSQL